MLRYPSLSTFNYSPYIMNIMADCIIQAQCMFNILFVGNQSFLIILSEMFQAVVYMSRLMVVSFFYQGCQNGQLCQMSDTVQPPVCNVCNSLYKFQAGSLPCLVSVILFLVYHSQVMLCTFCQTIPENACQCHKDLSAFLLLSPQRFAVQIHLCEFCC